MLKRFSIYPVVLMLILLMSSGCKRPADFSVPLKQVDSLAKAWESDWQLMYPLYADSLVNWSDSVSVLVEHIQDHFKGTMKRSRAIELSSLHSICHQTPELLLFSEKLIGMRKQEVDRLEMLRQALVEKADKDAMGNAFTNEYVVKAMEAEEVAHGTLITQLKKLSEQESACVKLYHDLYPVIKTMSDSLNHKQNR